MPSFAPALPSQDRITDLIFSFFVFLFDLFSKSLALSYRFDRLLTTRHNRRHLHQSGRVRSVHLDTDTGRAGETQQGTKSRRVRKVLFEQAAFDQIQPADGTGEEPISPTVLVQASIRSERSAGEQCAGRQSDQCGRLVDGGRSNGRRRR